MDIKSAARRPAVILPALLLHVLHNVITGKGGNTRGFTHYTEQTHYSN